MIPASKDELIELIGQWRFLRADKDTFDQQGQLTYKIPSQGKTQIIKLICRIENEWLITDQPSRPNEERTLFHITSFGELILEFEGIRSWYQKI